MLLFALRTDPDRAEELRRSLAYDEVDLQDADVDVTAPNELASIPRKQTLMVNLQRLLNNQELVSMLYMDLDGFKAVNDHKSL